MDIAYKFRGGTFIVIVDETLGLSNPFLKEKCTLYDVLAVHYKDPSFWWNGTIDVVTKKTMADMRRLNLEKPCSYTFAFVARQVQAVQQFYQVFLSEIRRYKGSEGTLVDGWWTWPEEDAHAPEPAAQPAAQPEAEAPAPAAPPVDAQPAQPAAAAGPDLEQVIRDKVAGEKKQAGPACPDCGCTSIFADKDETGAVVITCLNCGRKWHPGEHRSW